MSQPINTDQVADRAYTIIIQAVQEMIPIPTCKGQQAKARWQREEAIKKTITKLGGSQGLIIEIKP